MCYEDKYGHSLEWARRMPASNVPSGYCQLKRYSVVDQHFFILLVVFVIDIPIGHIYDQAGS